MSQVKIDDLLTRGIANIIPSKKELEQALKAKKKLNIYMGIDPTVTRIHLGHAFLLRKLQKLSELGHHVTFLIGDFTARVGDTSDKEGERPVLTPKEIKENVATYKRQAEKFLDFSKIDFHYNSEWLSKLTLIEVIELLKHFSVGDFISRELIRKRLDAGKRVALQEMIYPIMQGYDSLHLKTDLQLGGTDQTFNMQAGRTLIKNVDKRPSFVLTNNFLTGTDGRKMSKSWGNAIWVEDKPKDVYGKIMSIKDDLIIEYYTFATETPLKEIDTIKKDLKSGKVSPLKAKKKLALTVTTELYDEKKAQQAQKQFESVFQKRQQPKDMLVYAINKPTLLKDVLLDQGLVESGANFKRLVFQGGIQMNGKKVADPQIILLPEQENIIKIGKLKFLKITPEK